jgi:hypothetical protein
VARDILTSLHRRLVSHDLVGVLRTLDTLEYLNCSIPFTNISKE